MPNNSIYIVLVYEDGQAIFYGPFPGRKAALMWIAANVSINANYEVKRLHNPRKEQNT